MSSEQQKNPLSQQIAVEVGTESRQLYQKMMEYRQVIIVLLLVILVLAASYAGYNAYREHRLDRAEAMLDKTVLEYQGAQRMAALESLQDSMPRAILPRYWLESVKAAQELEDWDKALEYWKQLAQGGPDNWKTLGSLGQGVTLLRLGKPQEALAELERLQGGVPAQMQPVVMLQLAEAAEMAGDLERALSAYEELKARGEADRDDYLDFKIAAIRSRLKAENQ